MDDGEAEGKWKGEDQRAGRGENSLLQCATAALARLCPYAKFPHIRSVPGLGLCTLKGSGSDSRSARVCPVEFVEDLPSTVPGRRDDSTHGRAGIWAFKLRVIRRGRWILLDRDGCPSPVAAVDRRRCPRPTGAPSAPPPDGRRPALIKREGSFLRDRPGRGVRGTPAAAYSSGR